MDNRRFVSSIAGMVALTLLPAAAPAEILTFVMEGTVSGQYSDPPGLPPIAQIGDRARYSFTFDTGTPNGSPFPWAGGYYGLAATLSVGSVTFSALRPTIIIQHPSDLFSVESDLVPQAGEFLAGSVTFTLNDQAQSNALTTIDLPSSPYDLSLFEMPHFGVGVSGPPMPPYPYDSGRAVYGVIDSFYVIPEPFGHALMGLGIIACRLRRLGL